MCSNELTDFSIVGAGAVATHISVALQAAGMHPQGVYSRTEEKAMTLGQKLGCPATDRLSNLPEAGMYLLAIKDDALPDVIGRLNATQRKAILVHTAGGVSIDVFRGKAERFGVIYPLQTFSRQQEVDLSTVPCFIEASDQSTLGLIRGVAKRLSPTVSELDSAHRAVVHVAGVFANNFANHCFAIAQSLLSTCGLPPELLLPIIDETAKKVHAMPARQAQTGPALRNDRLVMNKHEQLLTTHPDWLEIYRTVSRSIRHSALSQEHKKHNSHDRP